MNYGISVLFRAIPLLMALFCFGYGWFITSYGTDPNRYVAGPVIFSLGMICIALFSTAATIIRQIIGTFGQVSQYTFPGIGYLSAVLTIIGGMHILHSSPDSASFVAGHVICGVGFITACVATTATSSTSFTMITENAQKSDHDVPPKAFTRTQGLMLISVAAILALTTWIWAFVLLSKSSLHPKYFVAGHVMIGLASICTCLITLVATILYGVDLLIPVGFPIRDRFRSRILFRSGTRAGRIGRHLFHAFLHRKYFGKRNFFT